MKNKWYLFFLVLLPFLFLVHQNGYSQGKDTIGDIKYSLLAPDSFRKLHGKGWVLMDGREIKGTKLAQLGFKKVPDARGVFLRGMNEKRAVDSGDADGDRDLGTYQKDRIKSHTHKIAIGVTHDDGGGHVRGGTLDRGKAVGATVADTGNVAVKETNPRNITVYIYVKIN